MTTRQQHTETPETDLGAIVTCQTEDGQSALDVRLKDETLWLTQKQLAALFETEKSVATKHINNVFPTDELDEKSVVAKFATTDLDEKTYQVRGSCPEIPDSCRGWQKPSDNQLQSRCHHLGLLPSKITARHPVTQLVIMSNFDGGAVEVRAWRGGEVCGIC